VLATAGCTSVLGIEDLTLAGDAGPGGDGALCYGTLVAACLPGPPTGAVTLTGIDTDTEATCLSVPQVDGPEVCAIAGRTITVPPSGAAIVGSRPLMLIATEAVTISGTLDVSSVFMRAGAGADPISCPASAAGGPGISGGGGGAGGSFVAKGGNGGSGGGAAAGAGGTAHGAQPADVLRGGCPGGQGGAGGSVGAAGGSGGGAVYIVAGSIAVDADVRATGAAGRGVAATNNGGGGGGAGGMVALEAPLIVLGADGAISASGGGGGEGSGELASSPGQELQAWDRAPTGGQGTGSGGAGGTGGYLALGATSGMKGSNSLGGGGGGGGGGFGIVWIRGFLTGTAISPTPTYVP
jgi:hypothetical protein